MFKNIYVLFFLIRPALELILSKSLTFPVKPVQLPLFTILFSVCKMFSKGLYLTAVVLLIITPDPTDKTRATTISFSQGNCCSSGKVHLELFCLYSRLHVQQLNSSPIPDVICHRCKQLDHGRRNFKDTNPLMSSLLVIFVWGVEAIL